VAIALACAPASGRAASPPPDVVLLTIDTLRADRLGCYGDPAARTPALDRLARRGQQYRNCVSHCPLTLPSHTSIFSGLVPSESGVRNNGTYHVDDEVPLLAEVLASRGRRTGGFVSALPLASQYGLGRGFQEYDDELPAGGEVEFYLPERPGGEVVDAAARWASGAPPGEPLFLWAHLFEPHFPYEPTGAFALLYFGDPYRGEVALADRLAARLFAAVEAARGARPVVIAASDHGEGLGDHGEATHGLFLFEPTLHVPLMVDAGALDGGIVNEPVGLTDVGPTVLRLAGEDPSPLLHGTNALLPPWREEPEREPVYSETVYPLESFGWSPAFSLRDGDLKAILSARPRGYRLDRDPGERDNRWDGNGPAWAAELLGALEAKVASAAGGGAEAPALTPEEREALAALGYTGSTPIAAEGGGDALLDALRSRPDMEDVLPVMETITQAENDIETGRAAAAVGPLRDVVEKHPETLQAHLALAEALRATGDAAGALEQYEAADRMQPRDAGVTLAIARLRRDAGNREAALEPYARTVVLVDRYRSWIMEAAECHALAGQPGRALAMLRESLRADRDPLDDALLREALRRLEKRTEALGDAARRPVDAARPADAGSAVLLARYHQWQSRWDDMLRVLANPAFDGDAEVQLYRGVAHHWRGELGPALQSFTEAVKLDDTLHLAHNNRAWILATRGRPSDALVSARRAVELLPSEPEYRDTLIEALVRQGRAEEARRELTRALEEFPGNATLRGRERGSP
jgi:tetratricopeptide (TPR) repeat protein